MVENRIYTMIPLDATSPANCCVVLKAESMVFSCFFTKGLMSRRYTTTEPLFSIGNIHHTRNPHWEKGRGYLIHTHTHTHAHTHTMQMKRCACFKCTVTIHKPQIRHTRHNNWTIIICHTENKQRK